MTFRLRLGAGTRVFKRSMLWRRKQVQLLEELWVTKSGVGLGGALVGVGGECEHKHAPNMLFLCKNVC